MSKMTVRQMLETGALEAELRHRIQNAADPYERRDAENALSIAKSWKLAHSKTPAGSVTKAVSVAVSIADVEPHELHSIAKQYAQEIRSGSVEKEIQARLLAAISSDDIPAQRTFATALVKARAAARIIRQREISAGKGQGATNAFGVTTLDMRALADTIGPPEGLPAQLGGSTKPQDAWDQIVRHILGPSYPTEYEAATADPASLQIKAGTSDDVLKRERDRLELARSIGSPTGLPAHLGGELANTGRELPAHLGGPKRK
jgi:mRNA-degrading endonuclease toxin of MazEF toxin-antitoxin module